MAARCLTVLMLAGVPWWLGCSASNKTDEAASADAHEPGKAHEPVKSAPVPRIMPETHLAAGRMLEGQGDFPGAVAQYERAIVAAPRFTEAYNRLGILYQQLGRPADAAQMFRQGIRVDPQAASLHNNLGYCHLLDRHWAEAEKEFRQALAVAPEFKRARMNLAIVLAQTGRLQDSVEQFGRVVPEDVAHYNVAVICLNRQDHASAEQALRRALEINPDCPGARQQLEALAARISPGVGPAAADDAKATVEGVAPIPLAGQAVEQEPGTQ